MTDTLLRVGAPTITYSGVGNCWLVDTGALVPIAVPGRRLAFEIAAAYVPPAGDSLTFSGTRFATTSGAGFAPAMRLPQGVGGNAPGSGPSPQDTGPGATYSRAAEAVGPAARADVAETAA